MYFRTGAAARFRPLRAQQPISRRTHRDPSPRTSPRQADHPPVAVPEGVAGRPRGLLVHQVDRPRQGRLQDRGLVQSGQAVGPPQEPTGHELRQAEPLRAPVLQERHHQEDRPGQAPRLPVLPALLIDQRVSAPIVCVVRLTTPPLHLLSLSLARARALEEVLFCCCCFWCV